MSSPSPNAPNLPPPTADTLRALSLFTDASDEVVEDVLEHALHKRVPAGLMVSIMGSHCHGFPIILNGSARVFVTGENGREITLYRLTPGSTCILSASCILANQPLPAYSIAESVDDEPFGDILVLPSPIFRQFFERHEFWRQLVFSMLSHRLANVIAVTTDATFRRLDARLADHLLAAAPTPRTEVRATHQAIADELGSSREVVSRILKSFEVEGLVELSRGTVRLLDRDGLGGKAQQAC